MSVNYSRGAQRRDALSCSSSLKRSSYLGRNGVDIRDLNSDPFQGTNLLLPHHIHITAFGARTPNCSVFSKHKDRPAVIVTSRAALPNVILWKINSSKYHQASLRFSKGESCASIPHTTSCIIQIDHHLKCFQHS